MLAGASIASDDLDATKIGANEKVENWCAGQDSNPRPYKNFQHVLISTELFDSLHLRCVSEYINYLVWRKWLTVKPKAPEGLILAGLYY